MVLARFFVDHCTPSLLAAFLTALIVCSLMLPCCRPTAADKEDAFKYFAAEVEEELKQQAVEEEEEAMDAAAERLAREAFEQE